MSDSCTTMVTVMNAHCHNWHNFHIRRFARFRSFRLLVALFAVIPMVFGTPVTVSAQDYTLLGMAELQATSGHYKDSPVVQLSTLKDTWDIATRMRLSATHRLTLDRADFVLDHAAIVTPDGSAGASVETAEQTGSAGAGDSSAAGVSVGHEFYQAYGSVHPAPWFTFRAGRQRMNWGTAYTFSVTDGLHPQHPDSDIETGFDGASIALRPSSEVSLELATALQNAVDTGDVDDIRYGVYGTAFITPVEVGFTLVYQERTTLRPGMVASVPVGPIMVVGETALEAYDPRGQQMDYQSLWSLGGEYTWSGDVADVSIMGEYLYNGLAKNYPETVFGDIPVTSDYAGGFARRGYRYAAGGFSLNILDSWSTAHNVLANLTDESTWVSHSLSILRIPGVDLVGTVLWNSGDPGTEFGDLQQDFVMEFKTVVHF
jgi:hypothetical protein